MEPFRGFLFDVDKWFADVVVARMSFAEKGVYLLMLFQQYRAKSLPDNPRELADLIAVNEAQAEEIERAWPVVRRKFIPLERDPSRIVNLKLEKTRRQQAAHARKRSDAGRAAGKASASKRLKAQALPSNESLTTVERPSTDQDGSGRIREERIGSEERSARPHPREVPRAHTRTVMDGALPRDHRAHVFCDFDRAICVPAAVHAKLIGPMAQRFDGDRGQAQQALERWYAEVAQSAPAGTVMGDAFRFWQPRFDAAFATPAPSTAGRDEEAEWRALVKKGPSVRP